jgi:hypothetical protein
MKKGYLIFAVSILILICCSCISFKIQSPLPPENELDVIQLCKNIDMSSDLLKPLDSFSEFSLEDKSVLCFIRLKKISSEIHIRWKWYSPENELVRDTEDVAVNSDDKYLEIVTAFDELELSSVSERDYVGTWIVVFFVDNKLKAKRSFQIKNEIY